MSLTKSFSWHFFPLSLLFFSVLTDFLSLSFSFSLFWPICLFSLQAFIPPPAVSLSLFSTLHNALLFPPTSWYFLVFPIFHFLSSSVLHFLVSSLTCSLSHWVFHGFSNWTSFSISISFNHWMSFVSINILMWLTRTFTVCFSKLCSPF